MATDEIRMKDLLETPDPRVPVCLCLDTSGSMLTTEGAGRRTGQTVMLDGKEYYIVEDGVTRLEKLQDGLQKFYDAIFDDDLARFSVELSIVTFDDTARPLADFSRVEYDDVREVVPTLETGDYTSLGAGINLALDILEKRKAEYQLRGVSYYQPWLVLMTDGEDNPPPAGDPSALDRARERVVEMVNHKKLCVYPFIIGTDEGYGTLASLSPKQKPMKIQHLDQIDGLFQWLSQSVAGLSSGAIDEDSIPSLSEFKVSQWGSTLG